MCSPFEMHPCLNVDEILRLVAYELIASELKATAVSLACCCRSIQDPVLDTLWETQDRLVTLLKCLPQEVWKEENGTFCFQRIPTKLEWTNFQEYTRRMRILQLDASKDYIDSEAILVLQLRTANEPFLPRLEDFECRSTTDAFIPLIPLFLSPRTANITITFTEYPSIVAVAAIISRFSTLCPDLKSVTLNGLPQNPVAIGAVSEMLLSCNRDSLGAFCVESPLTEEAREFLYRLPNLSILWATIRGRTVLPQVALPNLVSIDIDFENNLDWLQGFRGTTLDKLEEVSFRSKSERIGDFLGAFASVALTTSAQNSLFAFRFHTSSSWNPTYNALLPFEQLSELEIEFSCDNGCSSRVDDDVIALLARAMPKLETLRLGGEPCRTPTGATVKGLVALASRCPHLYDLRIHFQAASLAEAAVSAMTTPRDDNELVDRWDDCMLADLDVGRIPVPAQSAQSVALTLLNIFPRLIDVKYTNQEWKPVADTIKSFGRIGAFVRHIGKAHRHVQLASEPDDTLPGCS
ncbi:hypothetical protein BJ322DRAFT_1059290, partial [Thelephora terrestris]